MKNNILALAIIILLTFTFPSTASAQTYLFNLNQMTVNVYYNQDGTASIDYIFVFTNSPSASPIDYVDVGLPNSNFIDNSITADVNGNPITDISRSGYQGVGTGVALGLGRYAIQPGQTGRVHVFIGTVRDVLYQDSDDANYASAVFTPTWFGSQFLVGTTDMSVSLHMPPGVQPEEPRWHQAPSGWQSEPLTSLDDQGRPTYMWRNSNANGFEQYTFGASFPIQYVPADTISKPSALQTIGIDLETLIPFICCAGFFGFFIVLGIIANQSAQRRKLQYLPPKIAIEGHGIKRGLTAVEAAIILEESMDKVLTMVLFGVIKKGAASIIQRDPLKLQISETLPEGLYPYEIDFLTAFREVNERARKKALQEMMINLVKSVSNKLKGFSRRETAAYYRDIIQRAWAQVEAAKTPELKIEKYDEVMEWTMLDRDYDDRTREIFRSGPVIVPTWWGRFDPGYGRTISTRPTPVSGPAQPIGTGKISLPHLPGSDFAASVVNSVESFSANVIGNLTEFTSGITQKTNPIPVSTSSGRSSVSRSGGCACACACACAGCACACAGGGR